MNNSDLSLTPHEEKLTAYFDGRMTPAEAAEFEHAHPEVVAERRELSQLQQLLRQPAPTLNNEEFFNRQILRQIEPVAAAATKSPAPRPGFFNLWRLAFAGAACVLAAVGIYQAMVRDTAPPVYLVEVLSVKTGDPSITAHVVQEEGLTLVRLDGLEPMDEEFILN